VELLVLPLAATTSLDDQAQEHRETEEGVVEAVIVEATVAVPVAPEGSTVGVVRPAVGKHRARIVAAATTAVDGVASNRADRRRTRRILSNSTANTTSNRPTKSSRKSSANSRK